jgi:hypothetical protein
VRLPLKFDFDVHAAGQVEPHERVNRFRTRCQNVYQALVGPQFEGSMDSLSIVAER